MIKKLLWIISLLKRYIFDLDIPYLAISPRGIMENAVKNQSAKMFNTGLFIIVFRNNLNLQHRKIIK